MVTIDEYLKEILGQILASYKTLTELNDNPNDLEILKKELSKINGLLQVMRSKLDGKKYQTDHLVALYKLATYYIDTYDFTREIEILGQVYYKDSDRLKNLRLLIIDSLNDKKINIFINKKSSKDYLHIDEASDMLIKIIKKGKHRLYNIASGKNIELFKIAEKIKKITNCKINYKNQNTIIREPIINIDRIKKEFNFKPKKGLIESLDQLIINYKNYA